MREKGLYRARRPASGVEYAMVSFGKEHGTHDLERETYEARGYFPRFTMLPTKDEFDRKQRRTPRDGRIVRDD